MQPASKSEAAHANYANPTQHIDQLFQSGQALATDDPPLPNLVAKGIHHGSFGIPEKIPGIVTLSLFTLSHPTGVLEKVEGS